MFNHVSPRRHSAAGFIRTFAVLLFLLPLVTIDAEFIVSASGHFERPPLDWRDGSKIVGAGIEILESLCRGLGLGFEAKYIGPWKRTLTTLEEGGIDVMCGVYETEERKRTMDFREPIYKDLVTIFVWHDRSFPFASYEDLKGKRFGDIVGAVRGKEFEEWRLKNVKTEYVCDNLQNLRKLEAGRIDCFIASHHLGVMYIKKYGYEGRIIPLDKPLSHQDSCYAISKKSPLAALLPEINDRLRLMREQGEIDKAFQKYLDFYIATRLPDEAGPR